MRQENHSIPPVRLLIVDDSWVLRKVLREALFQRDDIKIIGEAVNGIEALEMILKVNPDVILLDMEMPTMDGVTTLQHLMIHTPIPTIMLSSLSKEGSARCFDALKYGAVDFLSKNSFFKGMDIETHGDILLKKVFAAAHTVVHSIDPMHLVSGGGALRNIERKVVFCEDCGTRNIVRGNAKQQNTVQCKNCGDEIPLTFEKRFRKANYFTVIGCGEGGYANLLKIIPDLNPEMGGALLVLIRAEVDHVESFVKYLDAISDFKVSLAQDGLSLESGGCYVFSVAQQVELSPYSGNYTLQMVADPMPGHTGGIDKLMLSASKVLKSRVAGVLLSGAGDDGTAGMEAILKNKGTCMILNPDHCLQKSMTSGPLIKYQLPGNLDETAIASRIMELHFANRENVTTA